MFALVKVRAGRLAKGGMVRMGVAGKGKRGELARRARSSSRPRARFTFSFGCVPQRVRMHIGSRVVYMGV